MKKFNKVFKNRQVLTSEEMNDIVGQINDIIGQLNEIDAADKYFKMECSAPVITGETPVTIKIIGLNGTDVSGVKIYYSQDGFANPIDPGNTTVVVNISTYTVFRAELFIPEINNILTKEVTVNATEPVYFGSAKDFDEFKSIVIEGSAKKIVRVGKIDGDIEFNARKGDNFFLIVPSNGSISFSESENEIYLDSIIFPFKQIRSSEVINGTGYNCFKSTGGEYDNDEDYGFTEDLTLKLTIY